MPDLPLVHPLSAKSFNQKLADYRELDWDFNAVTYLSSSFCLFQQNHVMVMHLGHDGGELQLVLLTVNEQL